jgi:hypothetical protein
LRRPWPSRARASTFRVDVPEALESLLPEALAPPTHSRMTDHKKLQNEEAGATRTNGGSGNRNHGRIPRAQRESAMREKKLPSMALVAALGAGLSLSGCGSEGELMQRDVYTGPDAREKCVADWGNPELCEKRPDDEAKSEQQRHDGGPAIVPFPAPGYYGPGYYGNNRTASHNGVNYTPSATRADRTAQFSPSSSKPVSVTAARPAGASSSVRGGFGAAGRAVGGMGGA